MARRHAKPVYRRPLQEVFAEHGGEAPGLFTESLAVLRKRGLHLPGLFTGQADMRKVRLLERAWDQGQSPLRAAHVQDCHAVAESLLLWLRVLPAPVIPCKLFRHFLRAHRAGSQAACLAQLHYLLDQLEPCELGVLQPLLGFLHEYAAAQRQAGGRCPQPGAIFGHALLRPYEGPLPMAFPEDTAAAAALVDSLVANFPAVFGPPHAAAGAHKPPSRAKRARRPEPGAPAAEPAEWPGRHLRVVVVPPFQDAEVCFMEREDGMLLRPPAERPAPARLATVPEACPLDVPGQDVELDALVGSLLCGSAQATLFDPDDSRALARAAGLLSCSAASLASEATDGSSEDGMDASCASHDSPLASPGRPPPPRPFACHPVRGWLEAAP